MVNLIHLLNKTNLKNPYLLALRDTYASFKRLLTKFKIDKLS